MSTIHHADLASNREALVQDISTMFTTKEREELVYSLLKTLPLSSIAIIQRTLTPLLQFDVVGTLPDELALLIFSHLPWESLVNCSLVCKRWKMLTEDPTLWRHLCAERQWEWRDCRLDTYHTDLVDDPYGESDDEGMGDEEDEEEDNVEDMLLYDSDRASMDLDAPLQHDPLVFPGKNRAHLHQTCDEPDYKLLFQTHTLLKNRFTSSLYSLSTLQTSGSSNGHSNTIYCLQLYAYSSTGRQVLFTGSKDRTVREWDIATGVVLRVFEKVHRGSVLSICARNGLLVSGGSDCTVVVWDLSTGMLISPLHDHTDSVLCVRLDDRRLVTCSKDRSIRTYLLPDLRLEHVLSGHRAAVNAVALSDNHIVSASGDRSMRVWDAESGALLQTYESHHGRGLASIDFQYPCVLSGSSDTHLRLLDLSTSQGWSTAPSATPAAPPTVGQCENCAHLQEQRHAISRRSSHKDLVRTVALTTDFVVSGSYDHTVKVWDRQSGSLLADLSGGHTGRIFCVDVDYAKIVSCGEDQRICIWDFSHGIDTSFIKLQ